MGGEQQPSSEYTLLPQPHSDPSLPLYLHGPSSRHYYAKDLPAHLLSELTWWTRSDLLHFVLPHTLLDPNVRGRCFQASSLTVLYPVKSHTLLSDRLLRGNSRAHFREDDLLVYLRCCALALSELARHPGKFHGKISTTLIALQAGQAQLIAPVLTSIPDNQQIYLDGSSDRFPYHYVYLSPERVTELNARREYTQVDRIQEDLFALGACLMQAALLRAPEYMAGETEIDRRRLLQKQLEQVQSRYPSLSKVIEGMVAPQASRLTPLKIAEQTYQLYDAPSYRIKPQQQSFKKKQYRIQISDQRSGGKMPRPLSQPALQRQDISSQVVKPQRVPSPLSFPTLPIKESRVVTVASPQNQPTPLYRPKIKQPVFFFPTPPTPPAMQQPLYSLPQQPVLQSVIKNVQPVWQPPIQYQVLQQQLWTQAPPLISHQPPSFSSHPPAALRFLNEWQPPVQHQQLFLKRQSQVITPYSQGLVQATSSPQLKSFQGSTLGSTRLRGNGYSIAQVAEESSGFQTEQRVRREFAEMGTQVDSSAKAQQTRSKVKFGSQYVFYKQPNVSRKLSPASGKSENENSFLFVHSRVSGSDNGVFQRPLQRQQPHHQLPRTNPALRRLNQSLEQNCILLASSKPLNESSISARPSSQNQSQESKISSSKHSGFVGQMLGNSFSAQQLSSRGRSRQSFDQFIELKYIRPINPATDDMKDSLMAGVPSPYYTNTSAPDSNADAPSTNLHSAARIYEVQDAPSQQHEMRPKLSLRLDPSRLLKSVSQSSPSSSWKGRGQALQEQDQFQMKQDQSFYEGEQEEGVSHGRGIYHFKDGSIYEGEWVRGQMEGQGKLYYPNGRIAYEGAWLQGAFEGYGIFYNKCPLFIEDELDFTNINHSSKYFTHYEGGFAGGKRHGFGTIYFSNGETFEGQFSAGKTSGNGAFFTKRGKKIEGTWQDGRMLGSIWAYSEAQNRSRSWQLSESSLSEGIDECPARKTHSIIDTNELRHMLNDC